MAPATLLERLRSNEILTADKLDDLASLPEASDADPRALARVILKRGWLTRYQINQIAGGRGKDLVIGYYLLLDRLGEGGMGQVFKAQHRHMGRTVALKLMRKEKLSSPDAVARFFQEVQAAARLTHPNIVIAFDAGQAGNIHYFSMEYVDGPDLRRLVGERGPLPLTQACDFIRQAALGLQHAHEQGLVHRDIKPSNLLVAGGASPVVKILDMGLARLGGSFENERNLTKMGQVLGTPDYLAPEQAIDARSVDIRADIYSLGCTLFFLLTGRTPFHAEALTELLLKHQMEPAPRLRAHLPDAPQPLETLLERMLAKSPADRPKTPAEVASALEPFNRDPSRRAPVVVPPLPAAPVGVDAWSNLTEDAGDAIARVPVRARGDRFRDTIAVPSMEARPRRKSRKNSNVPLLIGVSVGIGILLLIVSIIWTIALTKQATKTSEPNANGKQPARDKAAEGAAPANDGNRQPLPPEPKQPPRAGDAGPLFDLIEAAAQGEKWSKTTLLGSGNKEFYDIPKPGALLVGFEVGIGKWLNRDVIHGLRPIFQFRDGRRRTILWGKEQVRTVTLEAKPGYAVGKLNVRAGLGIDAIQLTYLAIEGTKLNPAVSYDSEWVGGNGGNLRSLGDGTPIIGIWGKIQDRDGVFNSLGLILPAPVKRRAGRDPIGEAPMPPGKEAEVGFPPGVEVFTIANGGPGFWDLGFTADGKSVVSAGRSSIVYHDLPSGKVGRTIKTDPSPFTRLGVSADGKRAVSVSEKCLQVWDLEAGKLLSELPKARPTRPAEIVLSPDGSYALSAASMDRRKPGEDGGKPEYVNGETWLWDLNQSRLIHEFPARRLAGSLDMAFTDDGKYVISSSIGEPVRIWDFKTKSAVGDIPPKRELLKGWVKIAPAGGSQLLIGTTRGVVVQYDIAEDREIRSFPPKKGRGITRMVTSRDRRLAVVMSSSSSWGPGELQPKGHLIWLLDLVKGVELTEAIVSFVPLMAAFSPDNQYLIVGSPRTMTCIDLRKLIK
jgi:serine/threonine protein kinase